MFCNLLFSRQQRRSNLQLWEMTKKMFNYYIKPDSVLPRLSGWELCSPAIEKRGHSEWKRREVKENTCFRDRTKQLPDPCFRLKHVKMHSKGCSKNTLLCCAWVLITMVYLLYHLHCSLMQLPGFHYYGYRIYPHHPIWGHLLHYSTTGKIYIVNY